MSNIAKDVLEQIKTNTDNVVEYDLNNDNMATKAPNGEVKYNNTQTSESKLNAVDKYQLQGGEFEYATDPKYTEKLKQVHNGLMDRISQTFSDSSPNWSNTSDIVNVLTMKTQRDSVPYFMFGDETFDIAEGVKRAYEMGIDPTVFLAQIKQETGGKISNVMAMNNTTGGVTYSKEAVQKYKKYGIELFKGSKRPDNEGGYYAKTKTLSDGILLHAIVLKNFKKGS